ncbi:MAG: transposase [Leptolyngbya foveolarum]|uniref:Transposase n=1 Tax=Leptolyngbya foveolarum TaxID=47253 RepID=A0A2W4UBR3_9CYAN|nr:MAG: transposase [Leptolyngbya foveolarum]
MQYAALKNKPRTLRSLTGFNPNEFEALLPNFGAAWDSFVKETFERADRKRAYGAGRIAHLKTIEDKLLFILFYYRQYPTQEAQGFCLGRRSLAPRSDAGSYRFFGMSQAQANEWIHRLSGLLKQALGYELQLPERRAANLERVLSACPSLEFLIDGTERPINRPKDKDDQKRYYRGKKKRHTVKNNVITERRSGKVLYLSGTYEGKRHDKKIADEKNTCFPPGSKLLQDTGFQGYRPTGARVIQPKKKPRGGELSADEKIVNRAISSLRVNVEHHIGGVKRCQILVQTFRNRMENFADEVMEVACGLHNFRVAQRG